MTLRDQAVLDLLRQDRDEIGPGLTHDELAVAAYTRWPERIVDRLRREGYKIDDTAGRYRLYHEPSPALAVKPDSPAEPSGRLFDVRSNAYCEVA